MHEYENRADIKKHEMNEALAKAFVTPVDREDLDMMSQQLDNVLDLLEEVLQKLYIYDIKTIQPSAIEYAKNLVNGCDLLCSIMGVGAVKRVSAINFGVVKEMVLTWVLTFPGCGLVGYIMTKIFMLIFT